jgi:hypothetical protein
MNPHEHISALVGLMAADIARLQGLAAQNRRPKTFSADLVRYTKALLDIIQLLDASASKEQAEVKKLSNDELAKLAREALASMGDKS